VETIFVEQKQSAEGVGMTPKQVSQCAVKVGEMIADPLEPVECDECGCRADGMCPYCTEPCILCQPCYYTHAELLHMKERPKVTYEGDSGDFGQDSK